MCGGADLLVAEPAAGQCRDGRSSRAAVGLAGDSPALAFALLYTVR